MIQDYLATLTTERNRAWEAQKELLDRAVTDKREVTAEERASIERTDADLDRLDAEIKSWQDREHRENEATIARSEYEKIVRPEVTQLRENAQAEQIRQLFMTGGSVKFDFAAVAAEKRAVRVGARGVEFRDLTSITAGSGGNLVPTDLVRSLYDYLEVFSGMRRTNATILTTSGGNPIEYPKVTSHGTAAIVGEGTAVAEADPAFGKTALTAYKYGQLLQVPRELLEDAGVDIRPFIAKDMGRAIARVTDTAYVTGSGTNAPVGIVTACGTGTGVTPALLIGTNATAVTYENLVDLMHSVNEEYRIESYWMMRDATAGYLRKIKDGNGTYIWQPSMTAGNPDMIFGKPVVTDPNVAAIAASAASVLYGDFSSFIIRDVGQVEVAVSTDFAFSSDLVSYRSIFRTDSDLVDLTGAVKKLVSGTA